jgi:hypothetical protein
VKERDEQRGRLLLKDPHLPWEGDFPYERLNRRLQEAGHPGLTPSSTSKEIQDALFDLMATGAVSTEDRLAWDELRLPERRLVLDFFMYAFEAGGESIWSDGVWDLPLPLQMPDFRKLADSEPEYEKALSVPSSFDPFPLPKYVLIDAELLVAPPVDIGPVIINEAEILGDKNDR